MHKELIERYIQIAIDNWFKIRNKRIEWFDLLSQFVDCDVYSNYPDITLWDYEEYLLEWFPFIELITSYDFLYSITKYLESDDKYFKNSILTIWTYDRKVNIDSLVCLQAKYISWNKLNDFIKLIKWDE